VQKLNVTLHKALASPEVKERFAAAGADPFPTTPQELAQLTRGDVERLGRMMADSGIKGE
jgi:tripartite-type tricarboxylate transporter receptor subunit TctC